MKETFAEIFSIGGKTNSLGRANEVIEIVLKDKRKLEELFSCLFVENAWVKMRAADSLEKVCRLHPERLLPYVDRLQDEAVLDPQPSIQWHLAQIYAQLGLTPKQKIKAINWLESLLSSTDVDWIVSANAMKTLVQFCIDGSVPVQDTISLLKIQKNHRSKSVVKKANKLLELIS